MTCSTHSRPFGQAYGLTCHTDVFASLHSRHVRHTQGVAYADCCCTPGMTRRPYDMFDTLKAPLRGLRGTAAHLAYEEPTGLFASRLSSQAYGLTCHTDVFASPQKHLSLHGSAAKPTVSRIIRKPLFLLHNRQIEEPPNHRRSEHRQRLQFEEFINYRR